MGRLYAHMGLCPTPAQTDHYPASREPYGQSPNTVAPQCCPLGPRGSPHQSPHPEVSPDCTCEAPRGSVILGVGGLGEELPRILEGQSIDSCADGQWGEVTLSSGHLAQRCPHTFSWADAPEECPLLINQALGHHCRPPP